MKLLKNILWVILLLAAGLSMVYLFVPDLAKHVELSAQDKRLSKRIDDEEKKNVFYKKEISNLEENPVYIEKIAREKLGLARPEEIIYKFNKEGKTPEKPVSAKKTGSK